MHVMGSVSLANDGEGLSFHKEDVAATETRFSHICENEMRLPNPPPPLPPPPPPLPPPPGLRDEAPDQKKKTVRSFFWKTIPEEQVKGRANVWTWDPVQQNFQIDVQEIEELFGQKDCQSNSKAPPTRGGKTRVSFSKPKEEVSILDPKRGLNVGIFLKQFRRSNQTLVDDIRHGNSERLEAGPLRELLKLLPEKDEVMKLKAYRGDVAKLPLADSFMHLLIQVPSYSVRIESMLLKEEFPGSCKAMRQNFNILRSATKELMCCEELHAVLHLVLQAGNILNAGGYAGNAVGFKLSSLLSLADTKSNKPGMNLLHFIALEAQKKDKKLLKFPLKLSDVQAASRISLEALDTELQALTSRTRSVEDSIQKDTELLQQLDGFLQDATSALSSLRSSQQQLRKEGNELVDFFCEDRETFRLDDCFGIFHTFCVRFTSAVKENLEREAKEAARRQQMQDKELKRRSWAGGEEVHGTFELRCSSETDMSTIVLKDDTGLLMALLTPKSQHRSILKLNQVTRGRSLNSQRTRNSSASSPFVAERELSTFFKMSNDHKVPRERGKGDSRTNFPSSSQKSELKGTGTSPTKVDSQITLPAKTSSYSTFISKDDVHTQVKTIDNANKVAVKSTSYSNQQSDHNNNENNQFEMSFSSKENLLHHDETYSSLSRKPDENAKHNTATKDNLSVVLENCTLVPELKAFEGDVHPRQQEETTIKDLNEEVVDNSQMPNLHNNLENIEKSDVEITVTRAPSPQRHDCEEQDKVIVWCVTGVCEPAGGNAQTKNDQHGGKNQGESQQSSFTTPNHMSSEPLLDSEKSASLPISSQPVSASRCNDSSLGPHPTEPSSASPGPGLTVDASEEDHVMVNQGKGPEKTGNERADVAPVSEQTTNYKSKNKTTSRHMTEKGSSTDGKAKLATSSKQSTKNVCNSKPQNTGMKPSTLNTASTSGRSFRTLTNSENQNTRRVVSITKTSQGAKHPEKPAAQNQSSAKITVPFSLPSSSIRRGERPSTAPLSQRSNTNQMPESKELRDQKVSGIQVATRTQNPDVQGRPSVCKVLTNPKTQTEEKICLTKLRALNQSRGGESVSAPVTPLHKTKTPPSSMLPGFARNTASSSFRRTRTPLTTSHLSNTGSLKASPQTSSSSALSSTVSCTGSLKLTASSRSTSPLRRSENIRSSTQSSHPNPLVPGKDHQQDDNGSVSDKLTHFREMTTTSRPNWR